MGGKRRSAGRILLDGKDLAQVPLKLLRGHAVAIIPQEGESISADLIACSLGGSINMV